MKKIVSLFALMSCDDPQDAVARVQFYREPKSKLCFAAGVMHLGDSHSATFSWVPCEKIPPELILELEK
jgi:hypothetical protein